jgi:hypothetical protein
MDAGPANILGPAFSASVAGAEEARISEAALFRVRRRMAPLVGCRGGNGWRFRAGSPAVSVDAEFGGGESVQNAGSSPAASEVAGIVETAFRFC